MPGALDQLGGVDIGMLVGFVRMDAHRRPDIGLALGNAQHVVPFAFARRDIEHRGNARRPSRRQHLALPLGQTLIVQMTMAVG